MKWEWFKSLSILFVSSSFILVCFFSHNPRKKKLRQVESRTNKRIGLPYYYNFFLNHWVCFAENCDIMHNWCSFIIFLEIIHCNKSCINFDYRFLEKIINQQVCEHLLEPQVLTVCSLTAFGLCGLSQNVQNWWVGYKTNWCQNP